MDLNEEKGSEKRDIVMEDIAQIEENKWKKKREEEEEKIRKIYEVHEYPPENSPSVPPFFGYPQEKRDISQS